MMPVKYYNSSSTITTYIIFTISDAEDTHEGESLLKAEYLGFPYSKLGRSESPSPIKKERSSPRRKKTLRLKTNRKPLRQQSNCNFRLV